METPQPTAAGFLLARPGPGADGAKVRISISPVEKRQMSQVNRSQADSTTEDPALLRARLRTMKMIALWAFVFGAGIGFVTGYTIGVDTAQQAAALGYPEN